MCEANVYMEINGVEELVMESVDILEPEESDTWRLVGIFGDQKTIHGRLKGMKLVEHRIVFAAEE
ncbi:MAG: CooT family nickel-binding protein [Desulfatitalea sp.]